MDVLFINAQDALELRKEVNGQLILGTLLLQAGFDVDILRFCEIDGFKGDYELFIQNSIQKILSYEPKAVSFYSLWPDYHIMLRIARELKAIRPDIYTVFGGPQPSATAQETMDAMPYVDFICSGEGENTVVPFFTALLRNNKTGLDTVPGLYYREEDKVIHHDLEHPLCDINATPHWDDRLYLKHYNDGHENYSSQSYYMPIDAGRGCPFSCTFCCTSRFWRRSYRMKTVDRIISEIKHYITNYGITSFRFSHDALTVNKKLIYELCNRIISEKLNIHWMTASRIDCIDEELVTLMKLSGLSLLELGIETGSERIQTIINKKLDLKDVTKKVKYLLNNKIAINLFFIYGFPEETEDDLYLTLSLLFNLIDIGANCSIAPLRFNPQTKMTRQHIDDIIFDNNPLLQRGIYGLSQELNIISNNKCIFPFYYNFQSNIRNEYMYLYYLVSIYKKHPNSMKYIRNIYQDNNLELCRDFIRHNQAILNTNPEKLDKTIRENTIEIISNTIKSKEIINFTQLIGILKYEYDLYEIYKSKQNTVIRKNYDFDYIEYKMNIPIINYTQKRSEIVLSKTNGNVSISLINVY